MLQVVFTSRYQECCGNPPPPPPPPGMVKPARNKAPRVTLQNSVLSVAYCSYYIIPKDASLTYFWGCNIKLVSNTQILLSKIKRNYCSWLLGKWIVQKVNLVFIFFLDRFSHYYKVLQVNLNCLKILIWRKNQMCPMHHNNIAWFLDGSGHTQPCKGREWVLGCKQPGLWQ